MRTMASRQPACHALTALLLNILLLYPAVAAGEIVELTFTFADSPAATPGAPPEAAPEIPAGKPCSVQTILLATASDPAIVKCFCVARGSSVLCVVPKAKLAETPRKLQLTLEPTAEFPYAGKMEIEISTQNLGSFEKPILLALKKTEPPVRRTLKITVTGPDRKPLNHAYVTVDRLTDFEAEAGATTDPAGQAVLENVRDGDYTLRVKTGGTDLAAHLEPVTVKADAAYVVALDTGVTVAGQVSGINPKNGKAWVSFVHQQYGVFCGKAVLNRDLKYTLALAPGIYKVKFTQEPFFEYIVGAYEVKAGAKTATNDIAIPPNTLKPLIENDPNIVK